MPTRYELFVQRWSSCTACRLRERRHHVVLARGSIPADIVWCGEGPGHSEDSLGKPFVGKAGKRLDDIVKLATGNKSIPIRNAFTNLLCCIPYEESDLDNEYSKTSKTDEPPEDCVEACSYRLQEFMEIADPKLIVAVGKHANDWLEPGYRDRITFHKKIPVVHIMHPSYILRQNNAQQELLTRKMAVVVSAAIDKFLC